MPRARIHLDVRLLSRARLEFRDKKRRGLGSDAVRNEHAEQLARPMVGDVEPLPFTVSRGQCDRECEGPRRICSTRRRRANRSLSGGHARDRRARRPLDRSPRPCARLLFATRFGILYSAERPGRSLQPAALLVASKASGVMYWACAWSCEARVARFGRVFRAGLHCGRRGWSGT